MRDNLFLNTETEGSQPFSIRYANGLFEAIILLYAAWTALAQFALIAGLSFKTLSVLFSLLLPVIFFLYLFFFRTRPFRPRPAPDYSVASMLLILAVIGAALALFAIRPDADDVNYMSRAVFYLENPSFGLDFVYRNHAPTGFDFYTPLSISHINTLLWAYFSWVFNLRLLDLYYFLGSALGGMLIPMAWYLVFSRFTKDRVAAVLGAAVVVAYLCIDGVTHAGFGNYSIVRIWQGKIVFMAVLLPLFIAFSVDFFKSATMRNWWKLFLLGLVATGLTSSAVFILPSLAVSLCAGYLFSNARAYSSSLKKSALYLTTLFHPILIGLYCLSFARQNISNAKVGMFYAGRPVTALGAFKFVFGGPISLTSFVFGLSVLLSLLLLKGRTRRFLAGWLVCVFVLFLNPLAGSIVAEKLTSANAYWRLIYILPFPLMVGIPVMVLSQHRRFTMPLAYGLFAFIIAFAALINVVPNDFAVFNKVEFGVLRYKLDRRIESDVRRMVERLPDGSMLAPIRYSSVIPMFTSRLPQVAVRGFELQLFAEINGRPELARQRLGAVGFVSGYYNTAFKQFTAILKTDIRSVVLEPRMANLMLVKSTLMDNGFMPFDRTSTYVAYVRRVSPAGGRTSVMKGG